MKLEEIRADLHVHTCLSPCAQETMMPRAIVRQAKQRGLAVIGICDHNSAENVPAVRRAGEREGLAVVAGMEVTTREEIHIMGLFGDDARAFALQDLVYTHLNGENDPDRFGIQIVADENDCPTQLNGRLLIGATDLSVERVVDAIHELDGLAVASHVDREAFSITSQLGFIPPDLRLDGLERAFGGAGKGAVTPADRSLPVVTFSDAHILEQVGRTWTVLRVRDASFGEIVKAFKRTGGRRVGR